MRKGWQAIRLLLLTTALLCAQSDLGLKSQRAKQAMDDRRFDEAVRLYSELVRELPQNPGLQMNLGLALHSAGRYRNAIDALGAALKLQPTLTPAKILIGVAYLKLGEPGRAIPVLMEAVEAEPKNRLGRLELADALLSTSHFQQAAEHFGKLAELDPREPKAWQGLGLSYRGLARQALDPLEALSFRELATKALSQLGKLPPSAAMHELMAEAHRMDGQYGLAAQELRAALQLEPGSDRLKRLLAEALYLNRDFAAALPMLQELVASHPQSASLNFQLGDLLLKHAEPEKAVPWLERAVKIDPGLLTAQDSLGRAYLRLGYPEKAIEPLKAALPLDSDGSIHFQLSRAYERTGKPELAREALQKSEMMSRGSAESRKALNAERQITVP